MTGRRDGLGCEGDRLRQGLRLGGQGDRLVQRLRLGLQCRLGGHDGLVGRHRLADMYDSPGAVCDIVLPGRDSLGETWLRVNPPIMFAINRTGGVD